MEAPEVSYCVCVLGVVVVVVVVVMICRSSILMARARQISRSRSRSPHGPSNLPRPAPLLCPCQCHAHVDLPPILQTSASCYRQCRPQLHLHNHACFMTICVRHAFVEIHALAHQTMQYLPPNKTSLLAVAFGVAVALAVADCHSNHRSRTNSQYRRI